MAKKKSSNIGLILTLVFFVLATFITGTVAYFGYAEVDQEKAKAASAKKSADNAQSELREERVRKVMLRIAMGVEDNTDRVLLVQELIPLRDKINDEYDRMRRGLNEKAPKITNPKDPAKETSSFDWPLLQMSAAKIAEKTEGKDAETIAGDPDVKPLKTLPEMISIYDDKRKQAEKATLVALEAAESEKKLRLSAGAEKTNVEDTFKKELARIDAEKAKKLADLDKAFADLVKKHAADAQAAINRSAKLGADDNAKADQIAALNDKIKTLTEKLNKIEDTKGVGGLTAESVNFVNMEEKKGEIVRKEEAGYVIINIGSAKKLKPQITFLVVSADVSWLALQEKEKQLDKNNARLDRVPYEDNPYVKAGIEVVEILGADRARCKVLFENEPIRNPIQPRDQIFNLAWIPDEEIRIAFAGIIDLDGDGIDNNEDFLRLLERQGIVVDEYMKMKPLDFVKRDGKGMSLKTRYLVIAPDPRLDALPTDKESPQTELIKASIAKMGDIKRRAAELGVQPIEARKFLAMIGYKLPKNALPPQYSAAVYFNTAVPLGAPAEPKKD